MSYFTRFIFLLVVVAATTTACGSGGGALGLLSGSDSDDATDIDVSGFSEVAVDGSTAIVSASIRFVSSSDGPEAVTAYVLSDGVSAVDMSPECVEEDDAIICTGEGSLSQDDEDDAAAAAESFGTFVEVEVDDGAEAPTVTATGSIDGTPDLDDDDAPENTVVVFDLLTGDID